MKSKRLNKDKLITFMFILIGIVIFSVIGYKVYMDFFNKDNIDKSKPLEKLDLYGYTLEKSDTDAYKKVFNQLEKTLNEDEVDMEKYAELLGDLFIIDFYTLTNKVSSTDVGSLEFILPSMESNFKLKASDTIYKYIETNFDGKRVQSLSEVNEITMETIEEIVYTIGKEEYSGYKIKYNWTYIEDLGYEKSATIKIVKDGSKLYVVESD